jgi:cytochrome c-type biogenesis protein CcmH/NrfG
MTDKAKAAYQKALELKPGYPEAAKALAEIK